MKIAIVAALALSFLGVIVLMGMPGAIQLEVWQSIFRTQLKCLKQDAAWPSAIIFTAIWPAFIPLAYGLVYKRKKKLSTNYSRILFASILMLASLLITGILELLAHTN